MKVVSTLDELRSARKDLPDPFGLVPTMGFLHEGHLSLVRRAKSECRSVGVSIFVNPTQFAPTEDLDAYPRDIEHDLALLESAGVDLVWTPAMGELCPPGAQTWVTVEQLTQVLEGAQRPGHFRGVTTVVAKLFNAFGPQRAYFGQKDAQQARVIQRMVEDLLIQCEVIICPIVREADGLAMSSRNTYLKGPEREAAAVLSRALREAQARFRDGMRTADDLRKTMHKIIDEEPLARIQYVSVADPQTLIELEGEVERALLSMAVYVGTTRLIDNILLETEEG